MLEIEQQQLYSHFVEGALGNYGQQKVMSTMRRQLCGNRRNRASLLSERRLYQSVVPSCHCPTCALQHHLQ